MLDVVTCNVFCVACRSAEFLHVEFKYSL